MIKKKIVIGTRGSRLALRQAEWVKSLLEKLRPDLVLELCVIKTSGDKILDVPLAKVGGKGLFVKEIEERLLDGSIDMAVHSMKDMPGEMPEGLCIGAVPERGTPFDVLISRKHASIEGMPGGARIGTSSLRRGAQVLYLRPDIEVCPLRGNLDTRIKKLESEDLDGIILAGAGVKRLNLEHEITEYIDPETILPAVGQGALCVEIRKNDPDTEELAGMINHRESSLAARAERAFLKRLEGGCQVPLAAYGRISDETLLLEGMVAETDGSEMHYNKVSGKACQAEETGRLLAEKLIQTGADKIITRLNQQEAHE